MCFVLQPRAMKLRNAFAPDLHTPFSLTFVHLWRLPVATLRRKSHYAINDSIGCWPIINHIMARIAVIVVLPWSILWFMDSWWMAVDHQQPNRGPSWKLQDKWKKCKGAIPFTSKQKGVDPFPSAVMSPSCSKWSLGTIWSKPLAINSSSGVAMNSFTKKPWLLIAAVLMIHEPSFTKCDHE